MFVMVVAIGGRALAAGNVTVTVHGGTLVVIGDDLDNAITLDRTGFADGQLRATSPDGTTVNGLPGPLVFSEVTAGVAAALGAGNDTLRLTDTVELAGGVVVNGGSGNDRVDIDESVVNGDLKFDLGDGDNFTAIQGGTLIFGKLDVNQLKRR